MAVIPGRSAVISFHQPGAARGFRHQFPLTHLLFNFSSSWTPRKEDEAPPGDAARGDIRKATITRVCEGAQMSVVPGQEDYSVSPDSEVALDRQPRHQGGVGGDAIALQAIDLTLGFGQKAILSDINVEVRRGAITALIGPTGSGKTTLLRTFNRMNDKVAGYRRAGDVVLDGRSIWSPGVELMALRRKVGMLFQR